MDATDQIVAGREAWQRLHDRERATWSDWVAVREALIIGRAKAMAEAKTNKPLGTTYNRLFGDWMRDTGFDTINNQERYRIIMCVEHREAIEEWRASLDPAKARRYNHPNAVWHAWRKATQPTPTAVKIKQRITTAAAGRKAGKSVFWSQDAMRRAHDAMLHSRSSDLLTLARAALQGAIRTERDLLDLLQLEPLAKPVQGSPCLARDGVTA